jgi:contactin associated protein-like 2
LNFLGDGYINYDLSKQAYQTNDDLLELRFKTNSPHGVIFYASGNQGDFMILQMNRGYLNFTIDLGQCAVYTAAQPFFNLKKKKNIYIYMYRN